MRCDGGYVTAEGVCEGGGPGRRLIRSHAIVTPMPDPTEAPTPRAPMSLWCHKTPRAQRVDNPQHPIQNTKTPNTKHPNTTMPTLNRTITLLLCLAMCIAVGAGCGGPKRQKRSHWAAAPRQAPLPPPRVDMPIDADLQARAAEQLLAATQHTDPIVRAHAIESVKRIGGEGSEDLILAALEDKEGIVRFAGAMAAGERRIEAAYDRLLDMLEDPSASVQVAVRYALHRLGDYRRSHDLETFARHPRPQVRANTVMVLGLLEEPSAVKILRHLQRDRDPAVALQTAEALWRYGDMEGLKSLVAASQSAFPDYQIVALMAMVGPKDHRVIEHVRSQLTAEHTEVQLAAARALGVLGEDLGYAIAQQAVRQPSPRLKVLAAMAFAEIGRSDAQPLLKPLLDDEDADVRLAAATALLVLGSQ